MTIQWIIDGGTFLFAAINGTQLGLFAHRAQAARQGVGASPSRRSQAKAAWIVLVGLSFVATGMGFIALNLAPQQEGLALAALMLAAVAPQWYFARAVLQARLWLVRPKSDARTAPSQTPRKTESQ